MPNWCKNNVMIKGNGEKIMEVMEMMKNEKGILSFEKILPLPKELHDTTSPVRDEVPKEERDMLIEKYGADNWYDWQCKNWGCKWDANEGDFFQDENGNWIATFQTPWGPPIPWLEKLSEMFEKITFIMQFADETCGQQPTGTCICKNGKSDIYMESDDSLEEFANAVWAEGWNDIGHIKKEGEL